ncbi:hypothetical protein C2G38_2170880 [Gigaspora rosea]|uniref:Uncharacterized protein n=1 Tax=Gigaspora rosea TaxID=44941 RepID=A0A397VM98_9GLOM|nr:hypothetical protein C2G38_2170880 [Gigaspora rosea]
MPHDNVTASNSQQPSVPKHSSSTSGCPLRLSTTPVHQPNYQDLFPSSGWVGNNPQSLPLKITILIAIPYPTELTSLTQYLIFNHSLYPSPIPHTQLNLPPMQYLILTRSHIPNIRHQYHTYYSSTLHQGPNFQ